MVTLMDTTLLGECFVEESYLLPVHVDGFAQTGKENITLAVADTQLVNTVYANVTSPIRQCTEGFAIYSIGIFYW